MSDSTFDVVPDRPNDLNGLVFGIDITATTPRSWTDDDLHAADVIITMGCGDICPVYRGKRYEDWQLTDPADQPIEVVRTVRDDIERRVRHLVATLNTESDS